MIGVRPALPQQAGGVSIIAQLFAMFVCMYRGAFPAAVIAPFCSPSLPYIHYKHIYIYM